MIDWLVNLDTSLFLFLNVKLANPLFDVIMPILTHRWSVRGVFIAIVLYLLIFDGKRGRIVALAAILAVAIADQTAASVIKPIVSRIRPCHLIEQVHLLVDCSQGLAFPSAHATNSVAVATLLSLIYRRARWYLIIYALLVSYSRIAVGVHYPIDVLGGALIGAAVGVATYQFYRIAESAWLKPGSDSNDESVQPE